VGLPLGRDEFEQREEFRDALVTVLTRGLLAGEP
jgi:hypothetical protein